MGVLILVCGVLIGMFISLIMLLRLRSGILFIVQTELEPNPQPLLDSDYPMAELMKRKYVLFKVDSISTRK